MSKTSTFLYEVCLHGVRALENYLDTKADVQVPPGEQAQVQR